MTPTIQVDPSNREQLEAWDGGEGAYWAAHARRYEEASAGYDADLFAAADLTPTDRVLDVGCGTGSTTRAAGRLAAEALGVDLSAEMLAVAQAQAAAEGLANVRFEQADAQVRDFGPAAFDVVLSRTGAMFFGDHVAAFGNLGRALRAGGRLVLVVWQELAANEWIQEILAAMAAAREQPPPPPPPDTPAPFSLSRPERVREILAAAGFEQVEVSGRSARMRFGDAEDDTCAFILGQVGWMLDGADEAGRRRAHEALRATVRAHRTGDGVHFGSAAWLVSARRPG